MFLTKSKVSKANLLTKVKNAGLIAVMCLWGVQAMAADGLTTLQSRHGPKDTMNRLEAEVKAKGMTVFARIDHAAGATAVGLSLRPPLIIATGQRVAIEMVNQSTLVHPMHLHWPRLPGDGPKRRAARRCRARYRPRATDGQRYHRL